jgi:hypothetical protein
MTQKTVPLKNVSFTWRLHHCKWRSAKFRPMIGLGAFEQGGTFIVPHLLWHGASVFPVSSEGPPHLVSFYDTPRDAEDLHCIITRILTGCTSGAYQNWYRFSFILKTESALQMAAFYRGLVFMYGMRSITTFLSLFTSHMPFVDKHLSFLQ